jgi:hypothetical protein
MGWTPGKKSASAARVASRYIEAGRRKDPKPNAAERAMLSAFKWGHITRAQLEEKIGKSRADVLLRR